MTIPDAIVDAAAEALTKAGLNDWLRYTEQQDANKEWARVAVTAAFAAFAALPENADYVIAEEQAKAEVDKHARFGCCGWGPYCPYHLGMVDGVEVLLRVLRSERHPHGSTVRGTDD